MQAAAGDDPRSTLRSVKGHEFDRSSLDLGSSGGEAIKVCVRVRPFSEREKQLGSKLCVLIGEGANDTVIVTNPRAPDESKPYHFDRAYWSVRPSDPHFASQQTLMDEMGEELVDSTLDGYNGCFFCYGQTGSGKSFSMVGGQEPELKGMLPRFVARLFERVSELSSPTTCTVNYIEIYNEQIHDLLWGRLPGTERPRLEIRQNPKVGVFIPNITDVPVTGHRAAMAALEQGMKARAVASTAMNEESSRSHCIFSMDIRRKVVSESGAESSLTAKFNFVDLAGSERASKTHAEGARLKEGAAINQSLANLALVISKLAEAPKKKKNDFIPFRNSKLTFVLMDSLSGNSKTVMLAALSPSADNYDETVQCLAFAQKVKKVTTRSTKNVFEDPNEVIKELRRQLEDMQRQMSSGSGQSGVGDQPNLEMQNIEYLLSKETSLQDERPHVRRQPSAGNAGEIAQAMNVDRDSPQLINKSYDPVLDGCLIFIVYEGKELEVGSSDTCQIRFPGLEPSMAFISNKGGELSIRRVAGRVLLNGRLINERELMHHGDRLLISFKHAFLVNFPVEAESERTQRSERSGGKARDGRRMPIMQWHEEVEVDDSELYQKLDSLLESLSNDIGQVRARVFKKHFQRVLQDVQVANDITHTLRPRDRIEFAAELVTDPCNVGNMPECAVRLKKYLTGAARWRYLVRTGVMRKSKMTQTLSFLLFRTEVGKEPFQTMALLSVDSFKDRLRHLLQLQGMRDRGVNIDFCDPANDAWREPSSSEVGAALARERRAHEELELAQKEAQLLRKRIMELERGVRPVRTSADDRQVQFQAPPSASAPGWGRLSAVAHSSSACPNGRWSRDAASEDYLSGLHGSVEAAFSEGLGADAAESKALQRHLERVEACASEEYQACAVLHAEMRGSLWTEVSCLRTELEHAQEVARAELAEQRASSRSALELVEFYVMHSSRAHEGSPATTV